LLHILQCHEVTAEEKHSLSGSDVGVCAVIGFPHGNSTAVVKVVEAEAAALAGASEIDIQIMQEKIGISCCRSARKALL